MTETAETIRKRLAAAGNDPAGAVFIHEVEETLQRTETDLGRPLTADETVEVLQALREGLTSPTDRERLDALLPASPGMTDLPQRVETVIQELNARELGDIPAILARLRLDGADELRTAAEIARGIICGGACR